MSRINKPQVIMTEKEIIFSETLSNRQKYHAIFGEWVERKKAWREIKKLQAIAALDNPVGTPSQWVIDLRASTRYLASIFVITAGTALMFVPAISMEVKALGFEAANIAFGFLFGSRIVSGFAKK